jgi:ketosteroid isomerase-like protein
MSQENVERVKEAVEAINGRNLEAALKFAHPDIEWQTLDTFPDAETYRGPEGVLSFFQSWMDTFKGFRLHLDKCEAVDEHRVLARLRVSGEGVESGVEIESPPFLQLLEYRDGLLIRARMFQTDGEALEAAGIKDQAMSQENVEVVKRAVAAVNQRDLDGYLACCTEDVQLITPIAEVAGAYDGADGIRRFFTDIADASPDFKIAIERVGAVGPDCVLAFMRVTGTGRASGIPVETATGNVYDFTDGRIQRIRIFSDRGQALEAAGLSE